MCPPPPVDSSQVTTGAHRGAPTTKSSSTVGERRSIHLLLVSFNRIVSACRALLTNLTSARRTMAASPGCQPQARRRCRQRFRSSWRAPNAVRATERERHPNGVEKGHAEFPPCGALPPDTPKRRETICWAFKVALRVGCARRLQLKTPKAWAAPTEAPPQASKLDGLRASVHTPAPSVLELHIVGRQSALEQLEAADSSEEASLTAQGKR